MQVCCARTKGEVKKTFGPFARRHSREPMRERIGLLLAEWREWDIGIPCGEFDQRKTVALGEIARDIAGALSVTHDPQSVGPVGVAKLGHVEFAKRDRGRWHAQCQCVVAITVQRWMSLILMTTRTLARAEFLCSSPSFHERDCGISIFMGFGYPSACDPQVAVPMAKIQLTSATNNPLTSIWAGRWCGLPGRFSILEVK